MSDPPPVPDRFADVVSSGGTIVERFDQVEFVKSLQKKPTQPSGSPPDPKSTQAPQVTIKLCVPLSIHWISYFESQRLRTRLSRWFWPVTFNSFVQRNQAAIQGTLDEVGERVDDLLTFWEVRTGLSKRLAWLKGKTWNIDVNRITQAIKDSKQMDLAGGDREVALVVTAIVRTRPALPPDQIWQPADAEMAEVRKDLEPIVKSLTKPPAVCPPVPAWQEVRRYDAVDTIVNALTLNKYSLAAYAENVVPIIAFAQNSYHCLTVFRSDVNEQGGLTSFTGHMMAIYDGTRSRTFFDPNGGIVTFPDLNTFTTWFTRYCARYQQSLGSGNFTRTYSRQR